MKECVNCGAQLAEGLKYCPYCGTKIEGSTLKASLRKEEPEDLDTGYRVVLVSRGTCPVNKYKEVMSDLLGYTKTTASELLREVPVEIVDELTELQAVTVAQALSEYGMEVTIVDENDAYVDFSERSKSSVFEADGMLINSAMTILATLTAANRVHRYRRYRRPSLFNLLFRPQYKVVQPVHVRRHVSRDPEPSRRIPIQRKPKIATRPSPIYRNIGPVRPNASNPKTVQPGKKAETAPKSGSVNKKEPLKNKGGKNK